MIALASAVFIASLIGSTHCAGMCGAFLAVAVTDERQTSRTALHAAYNLGRLATYTALGAIAGLLGAALDLGGAAVGLQRTAAVLAGAMMITFGLIAVLRAAGVRLQRAPLPKGLQRLAMKGHRAAAELPPFWRAGAVGLLTTLLPCGWLYAFVITAAGTGHPLTGAATMAVFWAGTLPMMVGLGVGLQALTGGLRKRLPVLTSFLIIAVGLWTVFGRLTMPVMAGEVRPADAQSAIEHVKSLDSSEAPCCHEH